MTRDAEKEDDDFVNTIMLVLDLLSDVLDMEDL